MGSERNKKNTSTCQKCGQQKRCKYKVQDKMACSSCSYAHRKTSLLQPFSFLQAWGIGSSFGQGDLRVGLESRHVLLNPVAYY